MSLKTIAKFTAYAGIAGALFLFTAPISGGLAGIIGVVMDHALGPQWEVVPLFVLIPLLIVYLIYLGLVTIAIQIITYLHARREKAQEQA